MNLITDKWISVINKQNKIDVLSINDVLTNSKDYIDISGSFSDRFVVYKLLFTIVQSSLKGIISDEDKKISLYNENFINYAIQYLSRPDILKSFDFYSKDFFYNFDIVKENEDTKIKSWRFLSQDKYATGNNVTVWDATDIKDNSSLSDAWKIIHVLKLNIMHPGHQNNSIAISWSGREIDKKKNKRLVFSPYGDNSIITYIKGNNIYDTLWLNLFDENSIVKNSDGTNTNAKIGHPLWEKKPIHAEDIDSILNSQDTFLGLSMPLFCLLSFQENQDTIKYSPMLKNGYEPNKPYYHPYKTYVKERFLQMEPDKHLIKDIPIILYKNDEKNNYNTGVIKNIKKALSAFESNIDKFDIKITSGGYISKVDSAVCTRLGEREMQIKVFSVDINADLSKITERYDQCINFLVDNFCSEVIQNDFIKRLKEINIGKDIKDKDIKDKYEAKIENMIYDFWLRVNGKSLFLSTFCGYSEEEWPVSEWFKMVSKIWKETVDRAFARMNSNSIINSLLLKEVGRNLLKSKILYKE